MRVLVACDKFAGTLTAVEAGEAIARGWRRTAPDDVVTTVALADGGPGFLDAVGGAVDGRLLSVSVTGPLGDQVPGAVLHAGTTAYVESAQACGLHLVPAARRDPAVTTTYGVGELVAAALDTGATTVVVGLGGSATNDGGAGMLAALGARPAERLRAGAAGLADLDGPVDLTAAQERVEGVTLVAATDVDVPLLGPRGATAGFAEQKGAPRARLGDLERALGDFASAVDGGDARLSTPGAGAAGGLGFGMFLLGARRVHGIAHVMQITRLTERLRDADLVITGEGALDWQSLRGKVVAGVAKVAGDAGRPVIVLAGRVEVGRRELASIGVDAAYAVADSPAQAQESMERPGPSLEALAQRVARTWSGR